MDLSVGKYGERVAKIVFTATIQQARDQTSFLGVSWNISNNLETSAGSIKFSLYSADTISG
jgi:hypothetical protein